MKKVVSFQCEICGHGYPVEEAAQKCEAQGKPTPAYKTGNKVIILDGSLANDGKQAIIDEICYERKSHKCYYILTNYNNNLFTEPYEETSLRLVDHLSLVSYFS